MIKSENSRHLLFLFLLVPWILISICQGQQIKHETGFPFLKYYSAKEYKAHTQNFSAVQGHHGLMYFGNFAGILEYDGVSWRLIPTAKQTKVSALGIDSLGWIYAGALGEMGYLAPDLQGNLKFISLTERLPENERKFQEISSCLPSYEGVYFISANRIFLWNGKVFKIRKVEDPIMSAFLVDNTLYFQIKGKGLHCIENDQIKPVAGGEIFTSAVEIRAMFAIQENRILMATNNQGLYLKTQNGIEPYRTEADEFLKENKITCGLRLVNKDLVFGTLRKGLIILKESGEKILILDSKAGIPDENVTGIFVDRTQSLWLTLNDGLAHIDYPAPFGEFGQGNGLQGGVLDIIRHQGTLYAATYQGLFRYNTSSASFVAVPGILNACWSLASAGNTLIAATSQGVYEMRNGNPVLAADGFSLVVHPSLADPSKIYVGQTEGVLELFQDGKGLRKGNKIKGITQEIREIREDKLGRVWFSGSDGTIFMLNTANPGTIRQFGEKEGLPSGAGKHLNIVSGLIYVTTVQGVFVKTDKDDRFVKSDLIPVDSNANSSWINRLVEDHNRNIWTQAGDEKQIALYQKQSDNRYVRNQIPFLPVAERVFPVIYPDLNNITWMGGPEGAVRYDPTIQRTALKCPSPWIRNVRISNDSVIFNGSFADSALYVAGIHQQKTVPVLNPNENTLIFEFASPSFNLKEIVQYQYFLEGFDKTFSEWKTESRKEYTNLPGGNYVFKVKAKDIYGNISEECVFTFRILKPWYRTYFAYFMYALLIAALLYFVVKWRSQKLVQEKKRLENLILERTAEVVQQKEELEQQSLELAYKNEELERINIVVKSINAQIEFSNLLQSILEKFMVIRGVERASAIVHDKNQDTFRFKAALGWDFRPYEHIEFSQTELEEKYLQKTKEISEDVFLKTDFTGYPLQEGIDGLTTPKAMLLMVIRIDNKVGGFLVLENSSKKDAFRNNDLSFVINLRQHIISAFIKTGILEEMQKTLHELKDTQDQLVQSEKLASLGQLTAGIAHEIQNPLNFVNNFAALSIDLAGELKENMDKVKESIDPDIYLDMEEVTGMISSNVQKILQHGKRAESIVKGMLQHSRGRTGEFELVDINNMVSEYVNLAYHGMRAKDKSFNTALKSDLDPAVGKSRVVPQDLSRVILNIVNNSCYAVDQKVKSQIAGYRPEITVTTKKLDKNIQISIHDNGIGIPQSVVDKIFNPFFTTKPTGQGTGLGLSMSFDIISQIHKGKLEVKTAEGEFTEFIITIPENLQK